MARWFGKVGFVMTVQTEPGVWEPVDEPREYFGDVLANNRRWDQKQDSTNDDLSLNNRISIVADAFANEHLAAQRADDVLIAGVQGRQMEGVWGRSGIS